jgi:hypothetical protein
MAQSSRPRGLKGAAGAAHGVAKAGVARGGAKHVSARGSAGADATAYLPWCPGDFAFRNALKYGLEENSFAHLDRRSLQFILDEGGGLSISLALASATSADRTLLSAGTTGPVIQEVRCLGSYCYADVKTTPTILVPGARCI